MGEKKRKKQQQSQFIFKKINYKWMLIGICLIILGFVLMAGGGSDDPMKFNADIYNFRRIRLAPSLILLGFAIQIYAILKTPKDQH